MDILCREDSSSAEEGLGWHRLDRPAGAKEVASSARMSKRARYLVM